jgi:hypothetical protein
MQTEDRIGALEKKFRGIGTQLRWWGVLVGVIGIVMAIFDISGGNVVIALGFVVALQGALIRYYFN